jgi:tetratricopeptide (TPR) repeat protein
MQRKIKRLKKRLRNMSRRTKLYIALGAAGAVLLVLIGILLVIINSQPPENSDPSDLNITAKQKADRDARVKQSKRDGALYASAEQAIEEGNIAKADEVYKQAINNEEDASRKVQLAIDQSRVLYAASKYDEAIKVAKAAEGLSSDKYLIADWLSKIYEDQQQYTLAAQYYTLAGEWATSPTNKSHLKKSYYDGEAQRVTLLARK